MTTIKARYVMAGMWLQTQTGTRRVVAVERTDEGGIRIHFEGGPYQEIDENATFERPEYDFEPYEY